MNGERIIPHLPGLRRYARLLTGDPHRADDLVQDTLLRACAKWTLWQPDSDLRAWLFTVMHNVFINQVRAAAPETVSIDDVDPPAREADVGLGLDLERALGALPADQREVLLMAAVEDLSYQEIARIIDIPAGTVMSRLSRARRRLRAIMEGEPQGAETRSHLKVMK